MPRGDGTGPMGGGRRGRGRAGRQGVGRGRSRGQGQGRRCGQGPQGRVGGQVVERSAPQAATASPKPDAIERAGGLPAGTKQSHQELSSPDDELQAGKATPVARVDDQECTPCGACQAVCPTEAISLGEASVKVDPDECCGCGACVDVCPSGAISLE